MVNDHEARERFDHVVRGRVDFKVKSKQLQFWKE